jgi:hypothetical protein
MVMAKKRPMFACVLGQFDAYGCCCCCVVMCLAGICLVGEFGRLPFLLVGLFALPETGCTALTSPVLLFRTSAR